MLCHRLQKLSRPSLKVKDLGSADSNGELTCLVALVANAPVDIEVMLDEFLFGQVAEAARATQKTLRYV